MMPRRTEASQPRPLIEAERLARRKRIARVATRRGMIEVTEESDAPVVAVEDDDPVTL